jgi:hypothetical protein
MRLTSQDHLLDILEENYLKVVEENPEKRLLPTIRT